MLRVHVDASAMFVVKKWKLREKFVEMEVQQYVLHFG